MVRPRTMKITALSVVFLIVTLAVPHVSLWNLSFGVGKAKADFELTISPTTVSTGQTISYSVKNAEPNFPVFLTCLDSAGNDKCSGNPFCTANAQGVCTFRITSDLPIGTYKEFVTSNGIQSNDVNVNVVAAGGSDAACSGATGVGCSSISPSLNYINGYFERGLCLSNPDKAYQCYLPLSGIKDCRSCIAQTTNFQGSSGIKYQWCQSNSNPSAGYCSYSPYSYECLPSHQGIKLANSCPAASGDDSGCANSGGKCETVTAKTGGYYVTNLCMSQPTTQNYQCFIPDASVQSCSDCTSGISSWCQKGTSGYCAINAPCVPNEGYTAVPAGQCSGSGTANKMYRCTKNNICISILSTDDPRASCIAFGDDPAGANVDYGTYTADSYNKCIQDAGGGTSSGQITLASTNPNPILENTAFTLTFNVPADSRINRIELKILPTSTGTAASTTYIPKTTSQCPPICVQQIQGLKKDKYIFVVNAQDSSGKEIGIGGSGDFTVGQGTTTGTTIPQTCGQCLQASANNFFCASTGYTGSTNILGTCKINGKNDPNAATSCAPPYYQPIYQENIAQCPKPLSCQEQCINLVYGGSYGTSPLGTVPYGQCSLTAPVSFGGAIGGVNTGVSVRAVPYGKGPIVGCNDNLQDTCWCTTVNPTTSGGLGLFGTTNFGLSSIPGTREIPKWPGDPEEVKNPRVAETNQLVCDAPSDATIIAKVSPQLAQAGEQITVSGDVGRISETCTGYERTCRKITQVGCQIKDRVLWQTLSCNDCPAGSDWPGGKSYSCIGEGKKVRWSVILGIGLGVTCAFVPASCAKAITAIAKAMGGTAVAGGNIFLGGLPAAVGFCSAISQGIFTAGQCTAPSQCASGQCVAGKCVPKITGGGTDNPCSGSNCAACDADKCKLTPGCQATPQLTCASAPGADTKKDTYLCVDLTTNEISCTKTQKANAYCYPDPVTAVECAERKKAGDSTATTASADVGSDANDCPSGQYQSLSACLEEKGDDELDFCIGACSLFQGTGTSGNTNTGSAQCASACKSNTISPDYDYGECSASFRNIDHITIGGSGICSGTQTCYCYTGPPTGATGTSGSGTTGAATQIHVSYSPIAATANRDITITATATGTFDQLVIFTPDYGNGIPSTVKCKSSPCSTTLKLPAKDNYYYFAQAWDANKNVLASDPPAGMLSFIVHSDSGATGAVTAGGIPITGMQVQPIRLANPSAVGGVAGALGGAAFGLCIGSLIDRMTPALNPASCISVCGKKYETKTGPNPVCDGAVVGEQEKSYKCSAGSCEGFPNKDVQITVYDSKGEVAAQATTKTDAAGHFDYTFTAPQVEGEYTASVVVPGLRASATATGNVAVRPLVP